MEITETDNQRGSSRHLLQCVGSLLHQHQGFLDIGEKSLTIIRKTDFPVLFFKQLDPEFLFQFINGVTEAGLGNVKFFSRVGVMQHAGKSLKIL